MTDDLGFRRRTALSLIASIGVSAPFRGPQAKEPQTLRIGIAQEAGNLDLLQNESALSGYGLAFEGLVSTQNLRHPDRLWHRRPEAELSVEPVRLTVGYEADVRSRQRRSTQLIDQ